MVTTTKRLLLATDAWHPQISGVVRTLDNTTRVLKQQGFELEIIHPSLYRTFSSIVYPEIRLAFPRQRTVDEIFERFQPTHVHIATEGWIGMRARKHCLRRGWRFTTSYHTKMPDYLQRLAYIPPGITWRFLKWFHRPAYRTMIPTGSLQEELEAKGFSKLVRWIRGVDTTIFHPREPSFPQEHRPILMYVGRVSKEKNIEAFLNLPGLPGTKYVVGDGPHRVELEKRFPQVHFLGMKTGHDLATAFANADVFVFPSLTDTYGVVMLEALACGVPVAAYPVTGPRDVINGSLEIGCLHEDLATAVKKALDHGRREACVDFALRHSWENCTNQFANNLIEAQS
ncbi:MAG: GDP-mannose-dependent alpha-mannosyltransferase [Phycisphaerae bacterium]|nr:GDP-mannose-dependent alpha-mannosyltransferase [Phycisphaerae bacterium]